MDARQVWLPKIVKHPTLSHTYSFQFLDVKIVNFGADLPMLQRLLREMYTRVHRQYYHSTAKYDDEPVFAFFMLMLAPLYGRGREMREGATKQIERVFVRTLTETQATNENPMPAELLKFITEDIYTVDVSHEELYFAPFLQSRVFILAFILIHFGENRTTDVVSYWNANPDPVQFTRDLCYFIALRFDETIIYSLDHIRYNYLHRVWSDIEKMDTGLVRLQRLDRGDKLSAENLYAMAPPSDHPSRSSRRPAESRAARRIARRAQDMSLMRFLLDPSIPVTDTAYRRGTHPHGSKKMSAYNRIYYDLLPAVIPLCPEECQRDDKMDFWKLRQLTFFIPFILRRRMKLFFDIASQYAAISFYNENVDTGTLEGICIYTQFFTETHMDMIADEIRKQCGQTQCDAVLFGEFDFYPEELTRPSAMAGAFNDIIYKPRPPDVDDDDDDDDD